MAKLRKVYWDSCVFIDWIQADKPDRIALIEPVVRAAKEQKVLIVTSALTMAEVVRIKPAPEPISEADEARIVEFFREPYIEVRNVDRQVARKAREVCRAVTTTGKKIPPPDAIHIATAILATLSTVHTFDENHLWPFDGLLGLGESLNSEVKLRICAPEFTEAAETDEAAESTEPVGGEQLSLEFPMTAATDRGVAAVRAYDDSTERPKRRILQRPDTTKSGEVEAG